VDEVQWLPCVSSERRVVVVVSRATFIAFSLAVLGNSAARVEAATSLQTLPSQATSTMNSIRQSILGLRRSSETSLIIYAGSGGVAEWGGKNEGFDDYESPQGLFADRKGNIYAANGPEGNISEFPPEGAQSPSVVFQDAGEKPFSVAVCNDGTLYASNTTKLPGVPTVEVYAKGSTTPTSAITDPSATWVGTVACDEQSNIYVSYQYNNGHYIMKYGPGGSGGARLPILPLGYLWDFQVDKKGDVALLVDDVLSGLGEIDFYHPFSPTPYGTTGPRFNFPYQFTFAANDQNIMWVTQIEDLYCPPIVEMRRDGRAIFGIGYDGNGTAFTGIATGVAH